jgi:hypothetical protein
MYSRKVLVMFGVLSLSYLSLCDNVRAQLPAGSLAANTTSIPLAKKTETRTRLLQGDEFLVDTAYLDDDDELQHKLTFERKYDGRWSADFTEELTLAAETHQLVVSLPAHLAGNRIESSRGFGDAAIEYSYGLYGNDSSRVTVSPGVGLSIPIGNPRKGLGSGGLGMSFKIPVGIMLSSRFALNSVYEMTYTPAAKNDVGESAATTEHEIGQSLVWFAKPKLNFFVESVWERSQRVTGGGLTENEYSFVVSPAVRWRHTFKSGLTVSPGIAVPIGLGPSRGENNIVIFIAFGHPIGKERNP